MQLLGSGDVIDNAVGEGAPLGHADENKCRTNEQLTPKSALSAPFSPLPPHWVMMFSLSESCVSVLFRLHPSARWVCVVACAQKAVAARDETTCYTAKAPLKTRQLQSRTASASRAHYAAPPALSVSSGVSEELITVICMCRCDGGRRKLRVYIHQNSSLRTFVIIYLFVHTKRGR